MFYTQIAKIHNSGCARSIIVSGNVYDLFYTGKEFVPLIPFLCEKAKGPIQIVYELNGPVRIAENYKAMLRSAWVQWKSSLKDVSQIKEIKTGEKKSTAQILAEARIAKTINVDSKDISTYATEFDNHLLESIGNPSLALEFLRQLTICVQEVNKLKEAEKQSPNSILLNKLSLFIIIEAADMLLPAGNGDIASLNDKQLHRISVMHDWFSDPSFNNGVNTVLLIAESRSLIHNRISKLPQVVPVEVPAPDAEDRKQFILANCSNAEELIANNVVALTAGLSLYAILQLIKSGSDFTNKNIMKKVEEFIQAQLGEDVIEFKKPSHKLDDCVGFTRLKKFLKNEMIPRFKADAESALSGAVACGSIGSGKTYIMEAMASELEMPVLVLKNLRSQWFGQTDVIFERLRRTLSALDKVMIFVDECDTVFGSIENSGHETEQRLTGKIQAMMSDLSLRGKVLWLLMTARIHRLSPDIRRPGRMDLIIPILDPEGEDRKEFLEWILDSINLDWRNNYLDNYNKIDQATLNYSSASFSSLKSLIKSKKCSNMEEVLLVADDIILSDIGETRRYQTLQALMNCTRKSLLPTFGEDVVILKNKWKLEIDSLEAKGIK